MHKCHTSFPVHPLKIHSSYVQTMYDSVFVALFGDHSTAIRIPLGPISADKCVKYLRENKLPEYIHHLYSYSLRTDVRLVVVEEKSQALEILDIFSNCHSNLKRATENETKSVFHFLNMKADKKEDVAIIRPILLNIPTSEALVQFSTDELLCNPFSSEQHKSPKRRNRMTL